MRASTIFGAVSLAASASASVLRRTPPPLAYDADAGADEPLFLLQTAGTDSEAKFGGLYLFAYHTGAGLNDAMLIKDRSIGIEAFELPGAVAGAETDGRSYFSVLFTLGDFPYELIPTDGHVPFPDLPGLRPVVINVGAHPPSDKSAFYFDENGLQWTDAAGSGAQTGFGGWLACQSKHADIRDPAQKGVQLFYRSNNSTATPETCADVELVAVYE